MKRLTIAALGVLVGLSGSTGCCLCKPGGWFNSSAYAPPPAYTVAPAAVEAAPIYAAPAAQPCCQPCTPCTPVATP